MLLSPDIRARLERMALVERRRVRGMWSGRHRSTRLGESLDFADYRQYHVGDDFRRIDYHLWARLGVVLVRLFEAEDELPLHVIVDTSASMGFGRKFRTAQELAAVVAYLALASGERVRLTTVPGANRRPLRSPWGRHAAAWPQMERWLEGLEPVGTTDLGGAARMVAEGAALRGSTVLVSDLMADDWARAVGLLGKVGGGAVLHVLSPEELEPDLVGDVTLRDAETGAEVVVSAGGPALARYRTRLESFLQEAAARARRSGLHYQLVTAAPEAVEHAVAGLVAAGAAR